MRKHAVSTRVFTFGIGNDASKTLVTGMAEAGEGKAEFVRPGDNMEEKVLRQLQRALQDDPRARYAGVEPMRDDLQRVLDFRAVAGPHATAFHRGKLFARRHRLSVE